jgi:hypothetical protein
VGLAAVELVDRVVAEAVGLAACPVPADLSSLPPVVVGVGVSDTTL